MLGVVEGRENKGKKVTLGDFGEGMAPKPGAVGDTETRTDRVQVGYSAKLTNSRMSGPANARQQWTLRKEKNWRGKKKKKGGGKV